jgi:hypothetical protein
VAPVRRPSLTFGSCLLGQHRSSTQVGVTWRLDPPDGTAMSTPRRTLSSLAFLPLRCLYGDFDAALLPNHPTAAEYRPLTVEAEARIWDWMR